MDIYVLMFQEKSGDFVAIHYVAVLPCRHRLVAFQHAKEILTAGKCDGRYVGKRCFVYRTDDHAMWELVSKPDGFVEVIC